MNVNKTFIFFIMAVALHAFGDRPSSMDHSGKKAADVDKEGRPVVLDKFVRRSFVWLYDQKHNTLMKTDAKGPLLPDRVYRRWDDEFQSWVFDLTGPDGKFSQPSMFLVFGSVLPGEWIGEEPKTRWIFRDGGGEIWDDWSKLSDSHLEVKRIDSVSLGNGKRTRWISGDYRNKPQF